MAKLSILKGATSVLLRIFIQDSSSTTGAGLTGLAFNTASLVCYRMRDDDGNAGATAITLATATLGTWATGGFKEKDATNAPGWYEFGIPNAALATGSRSVGIHLKGATNMAPLPIEIELTNVDNQDGVRYGLTALPNAAANAAGGLPVSSAGGLDLDEMNVDIEAIQTSTAGLTFTGAGKVDASVRDWVGDTIPARNVTGVPLVDAKYLLGTIFATPATAGIVDVNVKNINNVSASPVTTIKAVQGLTTADVVASVTGAVGSVTGAVGSVTGAVGSVGAGGIAASSFAANALDSAALATSAVTEIWANSCTEPTAAVAASPTAIAALSWLLTLSRNKITQSATTQTILADDSSTTIASAAVSDDGTVFSRAKVA